jgi:3-hydroxyacyl-CoA dehydrogenase/enoyl-CoA hydratase/3-hydroxybutyryl-CoA epimerase
MLPGGVCNLEFDCPDSSANVFNRDTLAELHHHLDELAKDHALSGLVFTSAKKSIFIAGADITELLSSDLTEDEVRGMTRSGQHAFDRIATLPVPTVAAIHGACLGGGLELCLACDHRIASPDKATKIGLPETSLGILPGWGGCMRLPRLVGLPKALDIILNGKRLAAKQALRAGVVDALVPREHFLLKAEKLIAGGKPKRSGHLLTNNDLVARIIASRVRPKVEAKTRGHYPAVPRALNVIVEGLCGSPELALGLEQDAITELARTDVSKNLVRIFFLQERSKRLKLDDLSIVANLPSDPALGGKEQRPDVAVIGAGVMGAGIAQWVSSRKRRVLLKDLGPDPLLKGMATAGKLYHQGMKRHIFTKAEARQGMERITPVTGDVPMGRVDIVIEAAVEQMEIKKKIFAALDDAVPEETVLATNTSALSITELGKATRSPGRVVGIHFFNPVHRMQLVELVVGDQTAKEVVERTLKFIQSIGKLPVVVRDRPGFVVNRILMPYLTEAGYLFENGANIQDLDESMLEFGMPMGPLRLIDEVGVDVANHVAEFFVESFGGRMPKPLVLDRLVAEKKLGKKTGLGFYTHPGGKHHARVIEEQENYRTSDKMGNHSREDLQERMMLVMLNEAARCIEEEVVSAPEDIDFAMIMGTGFAPFRGGPLRYLDSLGLDKVITALRHLAEEDGKTYEPCDLLVSMAKTNKVFYPNGK